MSRPGDTRGTLITYTICRSADSGSWGGCMWAVGWVILSPRASVGLSQLRNSLWDKWAPRMEGVGFTVCLLVAWVSQAREAAPCPPAVLEAPIPLSPPRWPLRGTESARPPARQEHRRVGLKSPLRAQGSSAQLMMGAGSWDRHGTSDIGWVPPEVSPELGCLWARCRGSSSGRPPSCQSCPVASTAVALMWPPSPASWWS